MSEIILRDYQFNAFKEMIFPSKGRIVIPTGGGKTPLEAAALAAKLGNDINNIGLVLAPRIVLIQQLMHEYRQTVFTPGNVIKSSAGDIIFNVEKSYRFIAFHSGEHEPDYKEKWFQVEDEDELKEGSWKEISTTSIEILYGEIEKARQLKQIPVIFSTYHSCFKLSEINFNTVINDEAHFLSQENFHDNYLALNAINSYCFTATEKHTFSSNGRGLNNTSKYGRLLSTTQPVELIEKGYITGVKLHIENFTTDNREKTYISEITEALDKNIRLSSKLPQYKIVVSTPGTKYIKMIEDNIEKLKKYGCPIFTISSKNKSRINNVVVPREEFLTKIKEAENAIVFHYDILSEGIDVDGITGVIINRNMSKSKALQTIGRAVRIYKAQPELKPYAWITVTCPNDDDDIKDFFKELIDEFVEEGYDPKDVYDEKIVKEHLKEEENVEDAYGADRKLTSNTDADDIAHYVYDRKQEVELEKFKSVDINNAEAAIKAVNNYFKEMSSYEN